MEARLCTTAPIPLPGFPNTFPPTTVNSDTIMHGGGSHLQWVDARPSQTGFTTWTTPNQIIYLTEDQSIQGNWVNLEKTHIDLDPCVDEEGTPCPPLMTKYAHFGIVARSLHPECVNAAMVSGAIVTVTNDVDLAVWRGLATTNGSENVGEFQ